MFDLPQDVECVSGDILRGVVGQTSWPWVVVAGFACQDLSSAGNGAGLEGARSGTYYALQRILDDLHEALPAGRLAYVVENTPMQFNWKHGEVREKDFATLCDALGQPVCLDAAQFGSHAHRLRNFWTNLADTRMVSDAALLVQRDPTRCLRDILAPHVHPGLCLNADRPPQFPVNIVGQEVRVLPTLMAMEASYQFRWKEADAWHPTRPAVGMLKDDVAGRWREPNVNEREMALGYGKDATLAAGVTEAARHSITGSCMDAHCMEALWGLCMGAAACTGGRHRALCDGASIPIEGDFGEQCSQQVLASAVTVTWTCGMT